MVLLFSPGCIFNQALQVKTLLRLQNERARKLSSHLGNAVAGMWEPTHHFLLIVDESVFQPLAH